MATKVLRPNTHKGLRQRSAAAVIRPASATTAPAKAASVGYAEALRLRHVWSGRGDQRRRNMTDNEAEVLTDTRRQINRGAREERCFIRISLL